jgi:hypothetical protein
MDDDEIPSRVEKENRVQENDKPSPLRQKVNQFRPTAYASDPESSNASNNAPQSTPLEADETPAIAAVLPTLPLITSWWPPEAVTATSQYAIPEDPCIGLVLAPEEDEALPQIPEELLGTPLAKNINILTKKRYQAVVMAGHEAMRMILGEMSEEHRKIFDARWMELYDFPSARVVNYMDRLNPLLVEFLALTQSAETLLLSMGELRFEAEMAAAYDQEAESRSMIELIMWGGNRLKELKKRIEGVSVAVQGLGEPPDPREDKCRKRKKAEEYLNPPSAGAWVLKSQKNEITWQDKDERISSNKLTFKANSAITHSIVPAKYIGVGEKYPDYVVRWKFDWTPPPPVLRPDEVPRIACQVEDAGTTYGDERISVKIWMTSADHISNLVVYDGRIGEWKLDRKTGDLYQSLIGEVHGKLGGWKRLTPQQEQANRDPSRASASLGFVPQALTTRVSSKLLPGQDGQTMNLEVRLNASYISGKASYQYAWDSTVQPPPPAKEETKPAKNEPAKPPAEDDPATALLQEKINFYKNQITLIEDDIKRYREMLGKIKGDDVKSREALSYSIMAKQADLQREKDQIATLKTGNYVRTRTQYDEEVSAQMQANSRKLAITIQENIHRSRTIDRLTKLLPVEEQYKMRTWAREQMENNGSDPETMRRVAAEIEEKAEKYNRAEAARYEEIAAEKQKVIDTLEDAQTLARYTMYATPFVSGGPALAFAYGITSGGIDGYHTGGLLGPEKKGALGAAVGGVTTAARYLSAHIDYALTFYEGYTIPDEQGNSSGVVSGLKNVAVTFIQRKAVQTVTQGLLRYQARTNAVRKQAKLEAWRDAKRRVDFKQEREYGRAMVERHQEFYQNYKQARKNGAPQSVIAAAEQRLMDQTAAIMHAPHAKGYLKFNASGAQQQAYNATSRLHINRVVNEYRAELGRQGFDVDALSFESMRNGGNCTPGMDTDIGVVSRHGNIIARVDPVSGENANLDLYRGNQTMQSIFNSVYRRMSGRRGAEESWVKVTTRDNLESYRDRNWLHTARRWRAGIDPKAAIDPLQASDAARVTEYKIDEMAQGNRAPDNKLWEQFRGTAKDVNTKVIPLLENKISNTSSPQQRKQLENKLQFYEKLRDAMNLSNHDPVAAEQAVKQLTSFDPVEAMKMTTIAIESLGKWD